MTQQDRYYTPPMDTPPQLPTDAPFDAIQDAILGAGKAGALQALALMEKVAEIFGNQRIYPDNDPRQQGWTKACAALLTSAQVIRKHAVTAPSRSVDTGKVDEYGQSIEEVQHLDAEAIGQIITEVLMALRGAQ